MTQYNYETRPTEVEAHRQMIVSANVHFPPNGFKTACPGDWIVQWCDGRIEVYTNDEFAVKFRQIEVEVKEERNTQ